MIKKILVLYGLFMSLALASVIEDEPSKNTPYSQNQRPGDSIEDWSFEGNFKTTFNNCGDLSREPKIPLFRELEITPLFENEIKKISLSSYKSGDFVLSIDTKKDFKCLNIFIKAFDEYSIGSFSIEEKDKFPQFLKYFYDNKHLSDCILDVIIEKMAKLGVAIKDFRILSQDYIQKFTKDLSQGLPEEYTEDSFKAFLDQKLEKIEEPNYRQTLTAAVVTDLQKNNPSFSNLIMQLAQGITDATLSSYSQIKLIQSDCEMNNPTEVDFNKRYLQALKTLCSVPLSLRNAEIQTQMTFLVKNIYNKGQLTIDPLPSALQDFHLVHSTNFDFIANILLFLSEQNQKIKEQDQKIKDLENRRQD